jgi:molybdopterin converting factor subunit 1
MTTIHVQYYAILREQAGKSAETIETQTKTAAALYDELAKRYPFSLGRSQLRVAVDDEFCDWDAHLVDGCHVVFIPPVAGG